jgi:Arc/MetJ-type ribon-helix-helix transcriptional regulator
MKKTTNVVLGAYYDDLIAALIENKVYSCKDQIMREGLRLLEKQLASVNSYDAAPAEPYEFDPYSLDKPDEQSDAAGTPNLIVEVERNIPLGLSTQQMDMGPVDLTDYIDEVEANIEGLLEPTGLSYADAVEILTQQTQERMSQISKPSYAALVGRLSEAISDRLSAQQDVTQLTSTTK